MLFKARGDKRHLKSRDTKVYIVDLNRHPVYKFGSNHTDHLDHVLLTSSPHIVLLLNQIYRELCQITVLSSVLSFPASPQAQRLLGRLAGPGSSNRKAGRGKSIQLKLLLLYCIQKITGKSGDGGYIKLDKQFLLLMSEHLSPCTVFQSELSAICSACKFLLEEGYHRHLVTLRVDSEAAYLGDYSIAE